MNNFQKNDFYHLNKFCNFKFGFLYKIPIIGTVLFLAIFKSTTGANIVDSVFYKKVLFKGFLQYLLINFVSFLLLIIGLIAINILLLNYDKYFIDKNDFLRELKNMYFMFPTYFILFCFTLLWVVYYFIAQTIAIKLTIRKLKAFFSENINFLNKEEIIYNVKITNFQNYIQQYFNQKLSVSIYLRGSDNFEFIRKRVITNFEGSIREKEQRIKETQNSFLPGILIYGTSIIFLKFNFFFHQKYNLCYLKEILKFYNYNKIKFLLSTYLFFSFCLLFLNIFSIFVLLNSFLYVTFDNGNFSNPYFIISLSYTTFYVLFFLLRFFLAKWIFTKRIKKLNYDKKSRLL